MWQKVYDEFKNSGFTILAVAMDTREAARPFIEGAKPGYPALIDRDHHVAALYNMVNVPEAVWIDETGRIVRPSENAGWYDGFRKRDRTTGVMPDKEAALMAQAKSVYMDAVRDWAANGAKSRHVLDADAARRQLRVPNEGVALAHTHFRLGTHLLRTATRPLPPDISRRRGGCIRTRGTSGARVRPRKRTVSLRGRPSGPASMRWASGVTTSGRTSRACPDVRRRR